MTEKKLIEKNKAFMESLWRSSHKEKNPSPACLGEYVRYNPGDPKFLYSNGFVDEEKYSYADWESAFEKHKQPDNTYLFSKEDFIQLGKYKYAGRVKKPLDVMQLREGWYELDHWKEFCLSALFPSTILTADRYDEMIERAKGAGSIENGRIKIDAPAKLRLKELLDYYPSPRRVRELNAASSYEKLIKIQAERSKTSVAKTSYEKGEKLGDSQKKDLKNVLMKEVKTKPNTQDLKETFSLKDLRKNSKTKKQTL